jgi:hypothetical protein
MSDPPPPPSNEEFRRRLREFLDQLRKLLDDLARNRRAALPGRFHANMDAAWSEVQSNFQQADTQLDTADESLLVRLREYGLTGSQLIFKLSIFQHAHDELVDFSARPVPQEDGRWWNRWRGLFRYALKAADVILGSLSRAMPVLEPIKEYKEAIETALPLEPDENK